MKHLIKLWPGDWFKNTEKRNKAVGQKNHLDNSEGKTRLVCTFRRQEFCKCIVCIILSVTYENKGHKLWGETPIFVGNKSQNKLHIDFCGNTDLHKVCCDIYHTN